MNHAGSASLLNLFCAQSNTRTHTSPGGFRASLFCWEMCATVRRRLASHVRVEARHAMSAPRRKLGELGRLDVARAADCPRTTRMERAAGGRIERARRLAFQHDPESPPRRIADGDRA